MFQVVQDYFHQHHMLTSSWIYSCTATLGTLVTCYFAFLTSYFEFNARFANLGFSQCFGLKMKIAKLPSWVKRVRGIDSVNMPPI